MPYIKDMGYLTQGGIMGRPDYTRGQIIAWTRTIDPYPQMTDPEGDSWDIRNQWTATATGFLIGRMGNSRISVNGHWVNQGQNDYNGEGFIPVQQGDAIGCHSTNIPDKFFFYPAIGGGD